MNRRFTHVAGLCAAVLLAGCQTLQDQADAEALATCSKRVDAADRKACRSDVMARFAEVERAEMQRLDAALKAEEDRELLRKVYGDPKDGD